MSDDPAAYNKHRAVDLDRYNKRLVAANKKLISLLEKKNSKPDPLQRGNRSGYAECTGCASMVEKRLMMNGECSECL